MLDHNARLGETDGLAPYLGVGAVRYGELNGNPRPAPEALPNQTKPIPRWDVHFGVLKMTERTPQPLVSPLGPNWVGTDSAV